MNSNKELELARSGCVKAQERLAWMYHTGENIKKSEKHSFYWYCKAALSGQSPISAYNLSISYLNGEGVKANNYKAFLWAKRSAKQGESRGFLAMGIHYLYGYGIPRNVHLAISYFIRSFQMDNRPESAANLARIYYLGDGVRKSYKKAFYWSSQAVIHGNIPIAFYNMSLYYFNGIGVKKDVRKSFLWAKKSALHGYLEGMLETGWHYLNGAGVKANIGKAEYWYNKALSESPQCSLAIYNLGFIYYYEYHDDKTAYQYFLRAYSIDHHTTSAYTMARMLATGKGVKTDIGKAQHLLQYAARKGNCRAQRLLHSKYWRKLLKVGKNK